MFWLSDACVCVHELLTTVNRIYLFLSLYFSNQHLDFCILCICERIGGFRCFSFIHFCVCCIIRNKFHFWKNEMGLTYTQSTQVYCAEQRTRGMRFQPMTDKYHAQKNETDHKLVFGQSISKTTIHIAYVHVFIKEKISVPLFQASSLPFLSLLFFSLHSLPMP